MTQEIVWNLSPLFKSLDDPEITKTIEGAFKTVTEVEKKFKGKINTSKMTPDLLLELIQTTENLNLSIDRVFQFANLSVAADQTNELAQALLNTAQSAVTDIGKDLSFIKIEIGKLLTKRKEEFLNALILANYQHYLDRILRNHPFTLSEIEEQIILEKDQYGIKEWQKLQSKWLGTRTFEIKIEGKTEIIPFGKYIGYASHPKREIRQETVKKVLGKLGEDVDVYATCMRAICADHVQTSRRRKYPNFLESSLIINDITLEMIEAMISAVESNIDLYVEGLLLKGKALGTSKLLGEDFYAPIPADEELKYTWEEAKNIVIQSYSEFDPDFREYIKNFFFENRIDASPRKGKRAGAFCSSDYSSQSAFILQSFTEDVGSVLTLAHELGHACHAYYYSKNQSYYNTETSFVMAEVASEFGSMLVTEKILANIQNASVKRSILFNQLLGYSGLLTAVFEVGSRTYFEKSLYDTIKAGGYLDAEKIAELFMESRKKYFRDAVEWLPEHKWAWCWKPHYYRSSLRFYNYPYVFAELVVLSLYGKYRKEGKDFVPKLKDLLAAGSSKSPLELGKDLGIDMADPAFWEIGISEIRRLLNELKELV
ncbi:MAG: M3 family oligoendopeptidase [Promethearchaeota archaeon]